MIARVVRERLAWFPYNCPDRLSITWDDLICARPSVYGVNETEHAKAGKRVDVQQLRLWCPFPRVPFLEHSAPFCSSSLTESLKPAWTIKGNPRISDYDWVVLESDWILRRRKDCSLLVWRIFWGFWSLNKHGAITLDIPPLKTCHSTSYHAGIWRVKWQVYHWGRTLWNVPELLT